MVWITFFLIMTLSITSLRGYVTTQLQGCPSHPSTIVNGKVVAGYRFTGAGNNIPELACNGNEIIMYANTLHKIEGGDKCFEFGSLIINPGCEVIFFESSREIELYNSRTLNEGTYEKVPKMFPGAPRNGGITCIEAYLTTCTLTYPTCVPSDGWETVTELDNTQGNVSTTFSYTKTVGTTLSSEITESFGESFTVKGEITASLFEVFSATLGVSSTTTFDWTKTHTSTKSDSTTSEVTQIVPPGMKVSIQQTVGHCGGSTVNTPLFRTIDG